MPKLIRSDKGIYFFYNTKNIYYIINFYFLGTETVLLAQSHLTLRRAN